MVLDILEQRHEDERGRDYAYRVLRQNIITMRQPPASILNEAELSEQLSMSRTPIREALILLKDERLVDIIPQRGSRVSLISMRLASEGYFMRLTLEERMLWELAGHLPAEYCKRLKENLQAQEKVLRDKESSMNTAFFAMDDEMHRMLYEFCGRERMYESVDKVCAHYNRIRYLNTAVVGNDEQEQLLEQHRTLYYYLTLGMPLDKAAEQFYEKHLGRWLKDVPHAIANYPQYFAD